MSTAVHSPLTLSSITHQNTINNSTHRPLSKQLTSNNNNLEPRSVTSSTTTSSTSNDSTLAPSTPVESVIEIIRKEGSSNLDIGVNNSKKQQQRTNDNIIEIRPIINLKLQVIPPYNASNRKVIVNPTRARRASAGAGDFQFVKESNSNKRRSEEPLDHDR